LLESRKYLSADLPNWSRQNHHWTNHPYREYFKVIDGRSKQIWPDGLDSTGVVRAFAAVKNRQSVALLLGIKGQVDIGEGPHTVVNPVTGDRTTTRGPIKADGESRLVVQD